MLVRFADIDQRDGQGKLLEIGRAEVSVPRAGDEQVLHFPNMAEPQVYIIQKIIWDTYIGGNNDQQSQNTEHLPPATQQLLAQSSPVARQMVLQQLSEMQGQDQSQPQQDHPVEQVLVVLKKMQPNNAPQTTHVN